MFAYQPLHFVGFAGSLRRGSYNRALLEAARDLLPPHTTFDIAHLGDIPFYNRDVEVEATPEPVLRFREQIRTADALLIATPEYNYSVPGVLKNALDWASRNIPDPTPLTEKPVAIVGAGGRMGTVRAQAHLRDILLHDAVHILPRPALMVARAGTHFDDEGNLINDVTRERLERVLAALQAWTLRLRQAEPVV